jgi:hypothetical protein
MLLSQDVANKSAMDLDVSKLSAAYVAGIRFHDAIRLHDVHQHSFQALVADVSAEIPQLLPALRDCVSRQLFAQLPLNGRPAQQLLARDALIEDLAGLYGSDALRQLMDFVEGFLVFIDIDSVDDGFNKTNADSIGFQSIADDLCQLDAGPWHNGMELSDGGEQCSFDSLGIDDSSSSVEPTDIPIYIDTMSVETLPAELELECQPFEGISLPDSLLFRRSICFSWGLAWSSVIFVVYLFSLFHLHVSLSAPILLLSPFIVAWLLWEIIQSVSST